MAKPNLPEGFSVKYKHERVWLQVSPDTKMDEDVPFGPGPKGGLTLAFVYDAEGDLAVVGSAHCHPKDNFNRRIGRDIALGRALHALARQTAA